MCTVHNDGLSIACIFLKSGADPDMEDEDGNVPILVASTEGFDEIVISLIDNGCNPDVTNKTGKAALHFLAMKNHYRGWFLNSLFSFIFMLFSN